MKKRFFAIFAACGLSLSAFANPMTVKNNFHTALKEVDLGGEYLSFSDLTFIHPVFNQRIPAMVQQIAAGEKQEALINQAAKSILNLININAFEGIACSSVQRGNNIFVTKQFLLANMHKQSILLDNTAKNVPLNWSELPADTRIAIKGHVNLARIWSMISLEMKFNPNPEIRNAFAMLEAEAAKNGININNLASAVNGNMEILITGTNIQDVAAKIVIPDANGAVSAELKKVLPPQQGTNIAQAPTPIGITIQVIYEPGKITAVSNSKLLQRPVYSLTSIPKYNAYTQLLPKQADSYLIVDIPKEVFDLAAAIAEQNGEKEIGQVFKMLKPISIVATNETKANGIKSVIVSDVSFYQLPVQLVADALEIGCKIISMQRQAYNQN